VPPRPFYTPLDTLPDDHPQVRSLVEGRYDDFVPTIDIPAFRAQAARVLDEMFIRWPLERIVAVCHGGIINAILAELLQLVDRFFFVFPAYTSLTILEKAPEGKVAIRAVNDTGHLVGTRDEGAVRPSVRAG
jgi:broad specificity phosphatase PhoE